MTRKLNIVLAAASLILALGSPFASLAIGATQGSHVLITKPIDETRLTTLVGNTRFEANARNDRGPVAEGLPLQHMLLQLNRSPELEKAFEQYIESLTDKSSPNFRHWMNATEQGEKYGLAQQDINAITGWLRSQGFTVGYVYPNRMVIDFSGTAGQVRTAFHTEIHYLDVNGVRHFANMRDPQIPAALGPAVVGVVSLHDFKPHAHHELKSRYSFSGCGSDCYALVPADFQTIYNVTPLIKAGITGQGMTVALVEDTDTYGSDWANYQSTFGLTSYGGKMTTVHPNLAGNCTDPGTNGADVEADLDVEMVTAIAPSATAEVISCSDTATTFGGLIAIQNIVNAGNPPSVISMSYGECEVINGAASNAAFNRAFQSAAAAGVSVFVSSGDSGPSGCAPDFTHGDSWAYPGIGVSGWGESVYNVSVGGTDFEDLYNSLEGGAPQSTYWSSTNGSTYGSALSYIPEIPWNDSCASYLVYNIEGYSSPAGKNGFCNSTTGGFFLSTVAGGGGPSGCAKGSGSADYAFVEDSSCKGYQKPSWQNVFGNPKDGVRDVPDVSMFASNGIWGHYVVICASDPASGGRPCTGAPSNWAGVGGTSVSAPLMAAVQALVNQKWNTRVGNPNPTYYSIANAEFGKTGNSSCYSINQKAGSSCVFNDITQGDTDISCRYNGDVFEADCYKPSIYANGVLSTQSISSITVTDGGSGYTTAPNCSIENPTNFWPYYSPTNGILYDGGIKATCTATINGSGVVTGVTVSFGGQGYTGVPLCQIRGGGGSGAKCTAVITPTTGAAAYQPAFGATAGWDAATGLGSVNAYNLVFDSSWQ